MKTRITYDKVFLNRFLYFSHENKSIRLDFFSLSSIARETPVGSILFTSKGVSSEPQFRDPRKTINLYKSILKVAFFKHNSSHYFQVLYSDSLPNLHVE